MKKKLERIVISGGGTGGHVFPAIAIADAIRENNSRAEILFVGAEGRMEMERVPKAGYRIEGLRVQGLDRKRLWRNVSVLWHLLQARRKARHILRTFRPQVVVGVGGYASAPTLLAAQRLGIATLIQEQNSYAGKANKLLAQKAKRICVAYPHMERFFPYHKLLLTGNPVRPVLEDEPLPSPDKALEAFGFTPEKRPFVLVLGGSLGARTINESIVQALPLFVRSGIRLLWQTGRSFASEAQRALQALGEAGKPWVVTMPFIDNMEAAFAAADVVVSRAGATTISELCLLAKPAILVPSPNVAEDHQTCNARALSDRGAALLVPDAEARQKLVPTLLALVQQPEQQQAMQQEISKLATPHAAQRIVAEIESLLP